ncbi:Uncharacterized protein Rs2_35364 [Raphanus sativus]|nr:Uncharacterized protein Rs2_35364 [Raphanus sativus]
MSLEPDLLFIFVWFDFTHDGVHRNTAPTKKPKNNRKPLKQMNDIAEISSSPVSAKGKSAKSFEKDLKGRSLNIHLLFAEDMDMRRRLHENKMKKLQSPNFHVSRTRILIYVSKVHG